MMPVEAFQVTMATKLHMTGSYDVTKYGHSPQRFNQRVLNQRKDKWVFNKLADRFLYTRRLALYVASVYVARPKLWVGDLANVDQYWRHYTTLRSFIGAPVQTVTDDTRILIDTYGSVGNAIKATKNEVPPIINSAIGGHIHIETVIMYDRMTRLFDHIDSAVPSTDPIWKSVSNRLKKYRPFVLIQSDGTIQACKDAVWNVNQQLT